MASEPGVSVRDARDRRPIGLAEALGQCCDESVMNKAGHRHRNGEVFCGGEKQAIVFESERQFELWTVKVAVGDEVSITPVGWCGEERSGKNVEECIRVESVFPDQREGLCQTLDHCGCHEIPGDLDQIRRRRLFADYECFLPQCVEQCAAAVDLFTRAGGDDK